ncbi:MAG: TMEM175 family protein [Candidatus Margulisbacteria bacterium]|nr:TMEM175 family protein [Candidatus Margulisiibacteriota bacterium]
MVIVKNDDSRFFDPKRLKDLGDGIFAFSMTFLIITIDLPKVAQGALRPELIKMIPDVLTYTLSFFLLAIFWMTNHIQMKEIKRADSRLVWINMLLFLMIVFVPLTTDLYSFYDGSRLAMLVFNLNILLIGLVFALQWHHLVVNRLHHEEFTEEEIKDRYNLCLSLIGVALLAIAVGLFYPAWCGLVYLIMSAYRIWLRKKWSQGKDKARTS